MGLPLDPSWTVLGLFVGLFPRDPKPRSPKKLEPPAAMNNNAVFVCASQLKAAPPERLGQPIETAWWPAPGLTTIESMRFWAPDGSGRSPLRDSAGGGCGLLGPLQKSARR